MLSNNVIASEKTSFMTSEKASFMMSHWFIKVASIIVSIQSGSKNNLIE
jgi:hypothetical protein